MPVLLQHLIELPEDFEPEAYEPRVEHAPIETLIHSPKDLREELRAKTRSTAVLFQHGMEATMDDAEELEANRQFHRLVQNRPVETALLDRPGVILKLSALLSEYDYEVVRDAEQMRTYITNRLLEESSPDMPANVRLRALENLGKITEVALFTERTALTVTALPTETLEAQLHERLITLLPEEYQTIMPPSRCADSEPNHNAA